MPAIKQRISVAMAVYNGEAYLKQQLDSLLQQQYPATEIIILDDCSTDDSANIIQQFVSPNIPIHYYKNEVNKGPLYTFRKLVSYCTGDYIAFCDQDDIWLPNKLDICMQQMQLLPTQLPAVVFTDLSLINNNNQIIQASFWKYYGIYPQQTSFANVLFNNVITGCSTLINKAMAQEINRMPDEAILHDHWIALIAYSFGQFYSLDTPTVLYRAHNNSVTQKAKLSLQSRFFNTVKSNPDFLKHIQQARAFKQLYNNRLKPQQQQTLRYFTGLARIPFMQNHIMQKCMKYLIHKMVGI